MPYPPVTPPQSPSAPQYAYGQGGGTGGGGGGGFAPGPAFIAHKNATQSISGAATTKVIFEVEDYDTDNCFTAGSTSRFQPTTAGFYYVDTTVSFTATTSANSLVMIFKNGVEEARGEQPDSPTWTLTASSLIYMNGSTDYIEVRVLTPSARTISSDSINRFTAFMARPA